MPTMSARMHGQMTHALTHLAEATGQSKAFMAINALLGCLHTYKEKVLPGSKKMRQRRESAQRFPKPQKRQSPPMAGSAV